MTTKDNMFPLIDFLGVAADWEEGDDIALKVAIAQRDADWERLGDAQQALRSIEQHLYDILRAGPGALWQIDTKVVSAEAIRFAVECLAQFQHEMMALMRANDIEPLSGEVLEDGCRPEWKRELLEKMQ